jgi:ATP-binding cassette subfamily G (WHITE) protein 2 (SNQ2)
MCDIQEKVNIVSLYQAGNAIYDLFDKVTVIAEGQVIYYGPRQDARLYFEDLGFVHMEGANTADYLTAVTEMAERQVRPESKGKVPNTASEFASAYRQSDMAHRMQLELDNHLADQADTEARTLAVLEATDMKKNKGASRKSPQVSNFGVQLKGALIREYQQRWGDKWCVTSCGPRL